MIIPVAGICWGGATGLVCFTAARSALTLAVAAPRATPRRDMSWRSGAAGALETVTASEGVFICAASQAVSTRASANRLRLVSRVGIVTGGLLLGAAHMRRQPPADLHRLPQHISH